MLIDEWMKRAVDYFKSGKATDEHWEVMASCLLHGSESEGLDFGLDETIEAYEAAKANSVMSDSPEVEARVAPGAEGSIPSSDNQKPDELSVAEELWKRTVSMQVDLHLILAGEYDSKRNVDLFRKRHSDTLRELCRQVNMNPLKREAGDPEQAELEGFINGVQAATNYRPPASCTHDGAKTLNEIRAYGDTLISTASGKLTKAMLAEMESDNMNKGKFMLTEKQIKHMRDRFLGWKLPVDFDPDGGVHFDKDEAKQWNPRNLAYEPSGTNLFHAQQAEDMIRHMLVDLPTTDIEGGQS